ncbi:MAG: hypothetical protein HIU83_04125 [Proteobacteria bacterium]|nr:hypothetical protein [Pseudomonadota bacterium]
MKIDFKSFHHEEMVIQAITSLVESAYSYRLRDNIILASILARYLPDEPPHGLTSRHSGQRFSFLRAYALSAALNGCDLLLIDLARPEIRKQLEDTKSLHDSRDIHEFKENVGALLPWHKLWAKNLLAPVAPASLLTEIGTTQIESASASRSSYREDSSTSDEIVEIWLDILIDCSSSDKLILHKFTNWTNSLKRPLYTPTLIKLARLSARTNEFQSIAYEFSQRAYNITNEAKEDSGSKAQTYIDLARAILSTDLSEAREYFNRAVEVVSKIGDEIFDRWQAMLDLADRAADAKRPVPETAYRLARCAEVAEDYDSKHFDWNGTMTAISGLCPSSALAIMSRWRDRNVGWSERLFPITINYLLDHRYIDPKLVPALVGFRAQWEYCGLVKKSFEACGSHCDREVILTHVLHYMRLEKQSLSIWEDLRATAEQNQLNVSEIDQFIEHAKHQETSKKKANNSHIDDELEIGSNREEKNWDAIFNFLELHTSNGLSKAYDNFRSSVPPYYHEKFFAELFKRITIGKEVELIRLFPDLANFDLYHFRSFLEQVPDAWKSRMAIKSALADTTKRFLSRYCMEITKSRYYQQLPLQTASELSGILEHDLIDVVLASIGESSEIVGSGRLFTLVGLLAGKLSHKEALEALNYSLNLFDFVLDVNDGDGAWTPTLKPPPDINAALAGYIWTALAAPETSLRWEAAHVVRGLCKLGGQAILGHLVALSYSNSGGPFADARLHFYHLHARQWLLIALARAAMESPEALAPHESFFIHSALNDESHVLIRHFASKAALSLAASGIIQLDSSVEDQLIIVNISSLPVTPSKNHERHKQHVHPMHRKSGSKRFSFDYDLIKDSFESLGDCFAMCAYDIESEGEKLICDDWQLSENGHWDSDTRARRGYFRDDGSGYNSRKDNLSFYLSYHAMMTVAGKLLATTPLHQDPDDSDDEFNDWLNHYLLTRRDGCWLSDRTCIPGHCNE